LAKSEHGPCQAVPGAAAQSDAPWPMVLPAGGKMGDGLWMFGFGFTTSQFVLISSQAV